MTSLWRHLYSLDMAALPLKASHKEQRSVIRFRQARNLAQVPFSLRCVQCMVTSVLRDQQYVWCKIKVCSRSRTTLNDRVPCCFDNWCNDHRSRFSYAVWPACDVINVSIIFTICWKNEKITFDFKKSLLVELVLCFCNSHCCLTLASCKRKLLGKILHWLTVF